MTAKEPSFFYLARDKPFVSSTYVAKIHQIINNATKKRKKILLW
jgi:hypothetical protein